MKIVSEDREADMGRTIQFLAEENVRLRQMNDALKLHGVDGRISQSRVSDLI